jgi:hypothetical protein
MFLYAWLLAIFTGGLVLNLGLFYFLSKERPAHSWGLAAVYGFCTHTLLGGLIMAVAVYLNHGYHEEIGYYVLTFVFAFLSVPAAQLGYFQRRVTWRIQTKKVTLAGSGERLRRPSLGV